MGNSFPPAVNNSSTSSILRRMFGVSHELKTESRTKNIENSILADVIPLDALIANGAEWRDSHSKAISILRSTSSITSVISSSIFIWMIMRSHDRLSTTQHRLLLGMCISDIVYSLSQSAFNVMVPTDMSYMTWNARGNEVTCSIQGFFLTLGAGGGLYYNSALNIYFLAVVKYNKSDEYIRTRIEPFLHIIPAAVALGSSISGLVKHEYNAEAGGNCIRPTNVAPHCEGYDVGEVREGFEIPCFRGRKEEGFWNGGFLRFLFLCIPIIVMVASLGMIYRAVRTQERKLTRYGVGALRVNLQQSGAASTPQQDTQQRSSIWGRVSVSLTALKTSLQSNRWSCKKNNNEPLVTRSNNTQSQSRAVMHKALAYTFSWLLCYGFHFIGTMIRLATSGYYPLVLRYVANIFSPLQGLFNLLIFMYPKIMAAKKPKRRGETVSWRQAFSTAFWSKGKGGKKQQGPRNTSLRGGGGNRRPKKMKNDAASGVMKAPKMRKKKRADIPQEEEKCEISMPNNLDPGKAKAPYSAARTSTYAPNISPLTEISKSNGDATIIIIRNEEEIKEKVDVENIPAHVEGTDDENLMVVQRKRNSFGEEI